MELTTTINAAVTATTKGVTELPIMTSRATWIDVVAEIAASCTRRASGEQLLLVPGAVGVLSGAAPVVWVHGNTDEVQLEAVLDRSPEVAEIYVTSDQKQLLPALAQSGWVAAETVPHMTHELGEVGGLATGLPSIGQLQPGDMADVRALLAAENDIDPALLACSYSDEFFTVAAPVWMFGARDDAGRLVGTFAIRRQGRSAMGFALTVDAAWRSTGLSTALVAAGVRQARAIGVDFMHAQASTRSASRLFDCGFRNVGTWQRLVRG